MTPATPPTRDDLTLPGRSLAGQSLPGQRGIAASRVRFLTRGAVDDRLVRPQILESWKRSRDLDVDADGIALAHVADAPLDTRLSASAAPVLRGLRERLGGHAISVVLTDQSGLVLSRLTTDATLERHLDRMFLAPGFSYAEEVVGTNGIGTALEVGGPAHVFGHEHYAEHLEDLACAGVPIHHPVSGRLVGAIDLTCWSRDAATVMLALAGTTADQIRQALLADASAPHVGLLREYLRTCARSTDIVFALNADMVMINDHARARLDPADQAALLLHATEALTPGRDTTVPVELPSGTAARMYCRSVAATLTPSMVVRVRLHAVSRPDATPRPLPAPIPLPGLVGSGPPWLRACEALETAFVAGEWVVLEGEPGVGKLALLNAVQLRRHPVTRMRVLDATDGAGQDSWSTDLRDALLVGSGSVVIRHVDRLTTAQLRSLEAALVEARGSSEGSSVWVALTLDRNAERSPALQRVLALFPSTLEVPPLRLHLEDLEALVPLFLARLGHGRLICSSQAMRLLMRMSWPGNIEQVHQMLRKVTTHRRAGVIQPEDLPPEVHSLTRRLLTPLEAMERDAIVVALADAGGKKVKAAEALGMSRATIYRKIYDYGIVTPAP